MSSLIHRFFSIKKICLSILTVVLCCVLVGCQDRIETSALSIREPQNTPVIRGKLSEVAPPDAIQPLHQVLEQYEPQVSIISPKPSQTFSETTVKVQLQVQDLPIFKAPELALGPHLRLILDNEPWQDIYDLNQPILLEKLTPGTHTLRVFATRPWGESFKNDGAYTQTTFHIFTQTSDNNPDRTLPVLTYNLPQGTYGAEPVLLDFYLSNAPLHLIAQENPNDEISDWRIRVTVNGSNFLLDSWQPIYLKGLEQGQNWVQLEFLDEKGNKIDNVFNNTVRVITYDPQYQDTLTQLVRGELSPEMARSLVDPNYKVLPQPLEEKTPIPVIEPTETIQPEIIPPLEEELSQPIETPTISSEDKPKTEEELNPTPATEIIVVPSEEPSPAGVDTSSETEEKTTVIKIEVVEEKAQPTPIPSPETEITSEQPREIILKNDKNVTVPLEITPETKKATETITLPLPETQKVEIKIVPSSETSLEGSQAKRPQWVDNLLNRVKSTVQSLPNQT